MSDINELIHAIRLAERLAEGVAREADRYPTENMTRVREALASGRIRLEELAISADVDLDEDHTELDNRLRRAMLAFAKADGIEVEFDPYAEVDETEITLDDGRKILLKARSSDLRVLITELRNGERHERVGDELYEKLKRTEVALEEARVVARQNEGMERELRSLYRIDPYVRNRVREMIDERRAGTDGAKEVPERARRHAFERLRRGVGQARLALERYDHDVRDGLHDPCNDTRHALKLDLTKAEASFLEAQLAR